MATKEIVIDLSRSGEQYVAAIKEALAKINFRPEPTPIYDTLVEEFWPRRWITLDTTGEVRFLDESLH